MAMAGLLCFWRLGSGGVHLWDETRYAENAREMLARGDYLNYFYDGWPDDWVAKPPLGIWQIALSFNWFGMNEWSLRLPSALQGLAVIALTMATVRLFRSWRTAALVGFILVTCRGVIGSHVSRTGDLDALFVLTAMIMVYGLARWQVRGGAGALLLAGLGAGLCFFTKGVMVGILGPGLLLWLVVTGRMRALLRSWGAYGALAILIAFVSGWYVVVKRYGQTFPASSYGHDAWETMIKYDIVRRYTEKIEGDNSTPLFSFMALDIRYAPWLYLLYVELFWHIRAARLRLGWRLGPLLGALWAYLRADGYVAMAAAVALPTALILTTSSTKFNWYYAVTTPYLAMLTVELGRAPFLQRRWFQRVSGMLAALALGMQVYFTVTTEGTLGDHIVNNDELIRSATHVYAVKMPQDNSKIAVRWRGKAIELLPTGMDQSMFEPVTPKILIRRAGDGSLSVLLVPQADD